MSGDTIARYIAIRHPDFQDRHEYDPDNFYSLYLVIDVHESGKVICRASRSYATHVAKLMNNDHELNVAKLMNNDHELNLKEK